MVAVNIHWFNCLAVITAVTAIGGKRTWYSLLTNCLKLPKVKNSPIVHVV